MKTTQYDVIATHQRDVHVKVNKFNKIFAQIHFIVTETKNNNVFIFDIPSENKIKFKIQACKIH